MKKGIHPQLFDIVVRCACGSSFDSKSTSRSIEADICSKCHPLYTGDQKFIDTAGRIEKFKAKYAPKQTTASNKA